MVGNVAMHKVNESHRNKNGPIVPSLHKPLLSTNCLCRHCAIFGEEQKHGVVGWGKHSY